MPAGARTYTAAVRLTIRHRYRTPTGTGLDDAASWDAIRQTATAFGVPPTRRDWERVADERYELRQRAEAISAVAAHLNASTVASYGVGTALMERHLVGLVGHLRCADFTPTTIAQVAAIAPEIEFCVHDLDRDPPLAADLHLFHRVDTELDDAGWTRLLERYRGPILMVMAELLTARTLAREALTRLRGGHRVGWVRNEAAIRALVPARYRIERLPIGDLTGFLLLDDDHRRT